MAFSYTYTQLKDAVQEWLEDDSDEFTDAFDSICNNAELRLIKDLEFSIFDQEATGTLTSATLTLPSGWVGTVALFITVSGAQVLLLPKPWGYVKEYGGTGTPIYYAHSSTTQITVAPAPTSQAYTLIHIKRPTPLSETTGATTTWLSANVPDAMFKAAVMESVKFLKMAERLQAAEAEYTAAVALARKEQAHLIRSVY